MQFKLTNYEYLLARLSAIQPGDDCVVWDRGKKSGDYGALAIKQKMYLVHRLAYELAVGPIPEGHHVLHRCDNPPCFRPSHLFTGTDLDNVRDMIEKGRRKNLGGVGERNAHAKLTPEDVQEVRRLHATGMKQTEIAVRYGLTPVSINCIVHRKSWKHM